MTMQLSGLRRRVSASAARACTLLGLGLVLAACGGPSPQTEALLGTVARGSDEQVLALMYGTEQLRPESSAIGLSLLRELRVPGESGALEYVTERSEGRLRMVIVQAPWLKGTPHGTHRPLLLMHDGSNERIIGTVLPFNELMPLLGMNIAQEALPLSAWYIETHGAL